MDPSVISGLAALAGAAIGGLTSAVAAWFTQRTIVQAQWVSGQALRRQDLYRSFIEVAERIAQKILDTYSEPDKSFGELRRMVKDHAIDLLHDFSQTCRMEQDS